MIKDELARQISLQFRFPPTADQQNAISVAAEFLTDRNQGVAMILRGSAGTGKTYLSGSIVRLMRRIGHKVCLLAPTGRAAKVFALSSGSTASTIHRVIYRQKQFTGDMSGFVLDKNLHHNTLFIIDESSMIANEGMSASAFGEGRLLDDVIQYVYSAPGCRILFTGDGAQLPPVGEIESPALSQQVIESYGLRVYRADLNEVLRQSAESGILYNATVIRSMIGSYVDGAPRIRLEGFADIKIISGNDLIDSLSQSYAEDGVDETIVVTRSNKRANIYNMGIRRTILDNEEQLSSGDMLMVVRNNYFWPEHLKNKDLSFIANGDRALVRRVRRVRELYGFTFADVTLSFPDYDDCEMEMTAMLDTLSSESPSLSREQNDKLFHAVMEDYMDIPHKRERIEKIKNDPYFNALQIKFAYAVTCHKAQGGQWQNVYVDQGYMAPEMYDDDYIRWLYTAFTRASSKLYLVNYPQKDEI